MLDVDDIDVRVQGELLLLPCRETSLQGDTELTEVTVLCVGIVYSRLYTLSGNRGWAC